ncbi:TetR/AcrR family transcriptional regulator [Clostridium sp. SHJSY1]|uniref:TetR/AcrR family transcriptional regulator n=1 Tax=Clostridium sp. SHJSY1 TaxID=2942483 RepID=UPI0028753F72|nr:TetR/AcrR family transcriptional regulator [Clostridium sp. SHJSY1]MDS0527944.1 TetR/AcrR family transcriptional regulator [Clostridium sp. SHJSY1]
MGEKDAAKQRLIDETIKMICEGKKPSEITVADITKKSEVGNGMVNYHFQSKDNLIRIAVKKVMGCATNLLAEKIKLKESLPAKERLIIILKECMDFIAKNSEIAKIAILDNLENNEGEVHLLSKEELYVNCLKEIYEDDVHKAWSKNYLIVSYLNYIFLKSENVKKEIGFDFYNKVERDNLIEKLVNDLISCNR